MIMGRPCIVHNGKTYSYFQELLITTLNNSIPLKSDNDIIVQLKASNMQYNKPLGTQIRYAAVQTSVSNVHPQ